MAAVALRPSDWAPSLSPITAGAAAALLRRVRDRTVLYVLRYAACGRAAKPHCGTAALAAVNAPGGGAGQLLSSRIASSLA